MNGISALQQYCQVSTQGAITEAGPHQLILMLLDGAIDKLVTAKGRMARSDVAGKGRLISGAIAIIDTLRVNLDHGTGGELAGNLERLYDYMSRRLLEANARNQPQYLDEVIALLKEIKEAWIAIPQDYRRLNHPAGASAVVTVAPQ